MEAVYIIVSGRVQGVGFRYFALHKATELNVTGWVKNTPDGRLEIEAEGETPNLQAFTDWIKIGPSRSLIVTFSVSKISPSRNFTTFSIHH